MAVLSKATSAALVGAVTSISAYLSPAVRKFLVKWTAIDAPGGGWRILAIVLALVNLKSLPFMWHVSFPISTAPVELLLTPFSSASSALSFINYIFNQLLYHRTRSSSLQ